jgi:hypothetical protein
MKSNRPLIRRTFLQERFDILIKKQRNGHATFNDLTELDDIVNRDPAIRESILEEMQGIDKTPQDPGKPEIVNIEPVKQPGLLEQLKAFVNRLFITEAPDFKTAWLN